MSSIKDPPVRRNLQATADLLDALQEDPSLLNDEEFIRRLSILRQKHEETTNFLAKKLGAPLLPVTSSSVNQKHVTSCRIATSSSSPLQFIDRDSDVSHYHSSDRLRDSSGYHVPRHLDLRFEKSSGLQNDQSSSRNGNPRYHRAENELPTTSAVREILSNASLRHFGTVTSVSTAMPSGLLLSSSSTKQTASHFATSSDVVEESFLEDGSQSPRGEVVAAKHSKQRLPPIATKSRSKSMQQLSEVGVTVPKPFQFSLRKSPGNTYAKKFMSTLLTEKKQREEEAQKALKSSKFQAKPVPRSTYLPTNTFATETKYVEQMRRKVAAKARRKFDAQNEIIRSKSEGNLAAIKPVGYVPPSTYISPIPVKTNARSRSATTRSAILIQEAVTPKGIKSHRAQSNLTHHLRHERCKLNISAGVQQRRISPPDFNKIHSKINEEYRKTNSKPSTIPVPFKFASRSPSAPTRHENCQEKKPEIFKLPENAHKNSKKSMKYPIVSTHATQLREELNKARIKKDASSENAAKNGSHWAEDNKKRIASFLGSRSKTEEDIAVRTRRKLQQQHEVTRDYMRQLAEMKQRVLNGPLIMEKQSALAQEHRLKRKFEERMKSAKGRSSAEIEARRNSEVSAAGTFIVGAESSSKLSSKVSESSSHTSPTASESDSLSSGSSGASSDSDGDD